jgi:hypothetical protein
LDDSSVEFGAKVNEYGGVLAEYSCTGTVRWKHRAATSCTFQAFQLRDGQVIVLCKMTDVGLTTFDTVEALTGTTHDGRTVTTSGLFETNYLPPLPNSEGGTYCAYRANVLDVAVHPTETASMSRFSITNLSLSTPELSVSHPSGHAARVRRADEYVERIRRLKTVKGIDVTGYLEIRSADADACNSVADDFCHLLSIACGTKVQWVARGDYCEDGNGIHYHHSSRVTKAYCPLPVIDPRHPKDTETFLETTIPRYLTAKDKWRLATGLVDAYLDAKAEADYLQVRGVKLAVAMEMLKEAFVIAGQPEFARSEAEFKVLEDDLKKAVGTVLCQHEWSSSQRAIVYGNLRGLNRLPFREHVTAICKDLDLALPESDVKLFVRCRDSLVHRGRFYTETANGEERHSVPPHPTPTHEYFWLVHVLDRLFLRIVGYRGPYIDWSDIENPARKSTF